MKALKLFISLVSVLALVCAPLAYAHHPVAQSGQGGGSNSGSQQQEDDDNATSTKQNSGSNRGPGKGNATSTHATSTATSTKNSNKGPGVNSGQGRGEERRSEVANFVQALLLLAQRDGGIGAEVRAVAHAQASTSDDAADDIDALESEGFFKKLIFGPDWKSVGHLRSTLVETENHIDRLMKARDRATSSTTQALLDEQIDDLKDIASSTEDFLEEHESTFSFLGWFFKFFAE